MHAHFTGVDSYYIDVILVGMIEQLLYYYCETETTKNKF